MNATRAFSLDHDRSIEDQILLKTALAVVVLRRRALGKARQVRFSGGEQQQHLANDATRSADPSSDILPLDQQNENDILPNDCVGSFEKKTEKRKQYDGQEGEEDNPQSKNPEQGVSLFQHHPLLASCPRPKESLTHHSLESCPSTVTERSSKYSISHVESMTNLVIPTTIPLYATYGFHSIDGGGSSADSTRKQYMASPIYDFQNADIPSFHDKDQTKYTSKIATYSVLDGLLLHLTSQSSFRSRLYPMIIFPVILPVLLRQSADNVDENKTIAKVLSLCTVLHRFILLDDTACFEDVVMGICKTLKMLYRHQLDAECISYMTNGNRKAPSITVENDPDYNVTIKLIDILAVNMIVLLEKIIALHLKNYRRRHASAISQSIHNETNEMKGVEYTMKILHQELGQLLVPIRMEEMAAFYVRDEHRIHLEKQNGDCIDEATISKRKMICNGLNTGGKLMLRLSLYDIVRKIC